MRMWFSWLSLLALTLIASTDAFAAESGRRLALVIGNSTYEAAGSLPNASRDARAFGAFLSAQGFDADIVIDVNRSQLAEAVSRFSRRIAANDVALFYYAGHGMQLRGENYLVATNAKLANEFDVHAETLALADVVRAIETKAKIALVFLDACRNNPLANRLNEEIEGATRSLATRGLAPIETESAGTMVAFAAAPGQVASDGRGENSPFTQALVSHLASPGLEIGTAFKRVIRDVREATAGKQSPQILSSLSLEFYFGPALQQSEQAPVAAPVTDPKTVAAEADFQKALRINTARIWTFFLAKHRDGESADVARQMLAVMQPEAASSPSSSTPQVRENELAPDKAKRTEIQLALAAKGYDTGSADGVFGAQTRRAITGYQKSAGLTETGYFGESTAKALGINVVSAADGLYSSPKARRYLPKDFVGLETDQRVWKAIDCDPWQEKVYGSFRGHIYLVIQAQWGTWNSANMAAKRCGGHLATIGSKEENDFVTSLISKEDRFFFTNFNDGYSHKFGPWIGLIQDEGGREPRGGWRWVTGEALTFTKWLEGSPNEDNPGDDVGMYFVGIEGKHDMKSVRLETWADMPSTDGTHSFVIEFD
ncbi:caspase family protein [Ensifer adhaerens]|uniref:caspase family protein n=1 Tax=Ensifer adhaerens TaxID=106592 RepID=UPI000FDA465D|nr:caspase family protein [Ensifer adhaerens]MDF8357688.1 caspase family protein [Ensifer adhaerens]THA60897.1 CHAT domain-containing protein [Ensifer adhaerens]